MNNQLIKHVKRLMNAGIYACLWTSIAIAEDGQSAPTPELTYFFQSMLKWISR